MTDKTYKVNEVAQIARVSEWTVRQWMNDGKIKYFRLPSGGIRFTQDTVDKLLKGE
jgi:excisionase family DNA binding protein